MTRSHQVQSIRAVVEQTIADLKLAKVMNGNKISSVFEFERVLDCVIALHNLRVLLKHNPRFDIPARRAVVPGEHVFKPLVPQNDVDLKIPVNPPNLSAPTLRIFVSLRIFCPPPMGQFKRQSSWPERSVFFFQL